MARLTRQVGIRTATVRLPEHSGIGPALIRTASKAADIQSAKLVDKRTQQAQVAAAAINFERDGDGNLLPPSLPIGENGLIAPSIYDRVYTHMVGQRYLQQMQIDVAERLNSIATKNRFDPDSYRAIAESYVAKVTELAPDRLKPDVNNTAQVRMVEHFNLIVRQKSERDHDEAKGIHALTIDRANDELTQYVESGASPEIIGAKMLEVRALIEQGDAFNFWLDDEKQLMLEGIDRAFAVSSIISAITSLPDDKLVHAEAIQRLDDFAAGIGTIEMVDESGNVANVPIDEIPLSPEERAMISEHAIAVLNHKQFAFTNLRDNRLDRDYKNFFNWFVKHSLKQRTSGLPLDMDRLYEEFERAHADVLQFDYDATLRDAIADIIMGEFTSAPNPSRWREDFTQDWNAYQKRYQEELLKRLGDRDQDSMNIEDMRELEHGARMAVGNVSGGNKQTADGAREIIDFYGGMTGRDMTQDYYEDLIANPGTPAWDELKFNIDTHMSKVGIWPIEAINAIIGKINAPEGGNVETIQAAMDLTRLFYDNQTFRNNMTDEHALGRSVGGALQHLFRYGGQPNVANVTKLLENYSDPNWSPQDNWNRRSPEDRQEFFDKAQASIKAKFISTWRTAWIPVGLQTQGFGFNPFDVDLAGIPTEVMDGVMELLIANAGFIDTDFADSFDPFISRSVDQVLHDKGYAPSQIGYSPVRHGDQFSGFFSSWNKPDSAIVQRPPEYYATVNGQLDHGLMNLVEKDFQKQLDKFSKARGEIWIADENAMLEYDGQASVAFGRPSWNIIILKKGIDKEILTRDGLFGGDRVIFDMREAIKINEENKAERQRINNDITRRIREGFQTGSDVRGRRFRGFGPTFP